MIITRNKIAIIGPYPPPYGGISVHIKRILEYIPKDYVHVYNNQKASKYGFKFYGIFKYWHLLRFLFSRYKVIHYHSTSTKVRLILSFIAIFKKGIYLHLHGASFSNKIKEKSLSSKLLKSLIKNVNILASNQIIYNEIKDLNPKSIVCVDAFIPPKFNEGLYNDILKKINIPKSDYIVSMVGWFTFYKNQDLYGFDIMLNTLNILKKKKNLDVTFISSVNGIENNQCYDNFIELRDKLNLNKHFLLIEKNLEEVYPLFLNSNIFVRPTNTDGNSVSIKEANWYGCKVIASDVVDRPKYTILFKNRDAEDLANKIEITLKNSERIDTQNRINSIKEKRYRHYLLKNIYGLEE